MADKEISQFTDGNTPSDANFVGGYATANTVGGNRRWSFANIASYVNTKLGLGTMSTQDADAVAITGGAIDGTDIGDSDPAVGNFTGVNISGLTGSRVVITNALKTLASLAYDTANTNDALVQRDSSGNIAVTGSTNTGYVKSSTGNALTAAGTTRADALQLAKQINNITTATSGTGVILPVGVIGMRITVFNGGANPIQVYASASETIDTIAGATGVPLTNAKRCDYFFTAANTWISAQLGVVSA